MDLKSIRNRRVAKPVPEEQLLIDTSRMNAGQAAALEVAEAARDATTEGGVSFAGRLLMGHYDPGLVTPFPVQGETDRLVGDALVADVSAFLRATLDPEEVDRTRTIPEDVIIGLRDRGLFRMKVPEVYGGLGLSQVNYNRVIQAVASWCASTAVLLSAHQSIGVPTPLKMFGTDEQKRTYLRRISDGALSAFALTEPGVGSDPARMQTEARLTDDGSAWILNGEKLWTTNGPIADLLVVMARTPAQIVRGKERRQITAFIVEANAPGVEVAHRCDFLGLRAIQNGVLRFRDVRVPAENVLWGEGKGLKLALRTLNTGRLTLPAACTGIAKQCLTIARIWGAEREQWGYAIGKHEAGRDKIADLAATTFAMEAVTWLTSHWADEGRDIRVEAGMAKLFCSEASWRLVDETLQLRGGRGYERADSLRARGETPWPVERMLRDARINTIIEGTSEIMRLFLAREALDPHLKLGGAMMLPSTPLARKLRTGVHLAAFYARWYPAQKIRGRSPWRFRGDALGRHERRIDRSSRRLAAALFEGIARHREKLEREQMRLGGLMDIGTELFAMAATIAYARAHAEPGAMHLADVYCRRAEAANAERFRALGAAHRRASNRLAGEVLDGRYRWLESGVVSMEQGVPSLDDGAS